MPTLLAHCRNNADNEPTLHVLQHSRVYLDYARHGKFHWALKPLSCEKIVRDTRELKKLIYQIKKSNMFIERRLTLGNGFIGFIPVLLAFSEEIFLVSFLLLSKDEL